MPPPPQIKKKDNKLATKALKKYKATPVTPPPYASNVWVPSLKDEEGNLILTTAKAFGNHIMCAQFNCALVLPEDNDSCVDIDEVQCLTRLNRARYQVTILARYSCLFSFC